MHCLTGVCATLSLLFLACTVKRSSKCARAVSLLFSVHLLALARRRSDSVPRVPSKPGDVLPRNSCSIVTWKTTTLQVKERSWSASVPTQHAISNFLVLVGLQAPAPLAAALSKKHCCGQLQHQQTEFQSATKR